MQNSDNLFNIFNNEDIPNPITFLPPMEKLTTDVLFSNENNTEDTKDIITNFEYEEFEDPDEQENNQNNNYDINEQIQIKEIPVPNLQKVKNSNPNSNSNYNSNIDKTLFSKIAEDMFNRISSNQSDIKKMNNINNVNYNYSIIYNDLLKDKFFQGNQYKVPYKRTEAVKDFLNRNEVKKNDKINDDKMKQDRMVRIQNYDIYKDEPNFIYKKNNYKKCNDEQMKIFNENQKCFIDKKNKKLQELKDKNIKKETEELQSKPKVNKKLNKSMFKVNKNNLNNQTNNVNNINNVHNNMNNKSTLKSKSTSKPYNNTAKPATRNKKTLFPKHDNTESNNLKSPSKSNINNRTINLAKNKNKIDLSKSCEYFNQNDNNNLILPYSNKLIFKSLMDDIEKEVIALTSNKLDTNPIINKEQFNNLFYSLYFFNNSTNDKDYETKTKIIINTIWSLLKQIKANSSNEKILNNENFPPKVPNNDNIDTLNIDIVIIFIIIIYDLYNDSFLPILKSKLKWLNFSTYKIPIKQITAIKLKYNDLYLNRQRNKLQIKKEQRHSQKDDTSNQNPSRSINTYNNNYLYKNNYTIQNWPKPSENYNNILKQREEKIDIMRQKQNQKIQEECTFSPKLNKYNMSKSLEKNQNTIEDVCNRLYSSNKHPNNQNNTIAKTKNQLDDEINSTFQPNLLKNSGYELFSKNNGIINRDINVKNQIERYKNARMKKKELDIANNNIYRPCGMNFNNEDNAIWCKNNLKNELCNNKNNFGNKGGYSNTDSNFYDGYAKNSLGWSNNKEKINIPILSFEIKIGQRYEILNYYDGEDVYKIAQDFASRNNLTEESKEQIIKTIQNKLMVKNSGK